MRLLNTYSLELEEFGGNDTPCYAILSHTWEKEEVSFQDMQDGTAVNKAGYAKILASCDQAARAALCYIWVDTCCIDKTSSAELTEAINSMYQWYQNAYVCYAYLSDVSVLQDSKVDGSAFAKSRWFTRGWTLQELIAPSRLIFYSRDWKPFGTRAELKAKISDITGINVNILDGQSPQSASVAARMFWASKRVTTRVEDTAYCLMGLFDVNMPLLYGEGGNAFIRLQEEIMKVSDDHSLFAWKGEIIDNRRTYLYTGLLANSPNCFVDSGNIVPTRKDHNSIPFATTNLGLRIELVLAPHKVERGLSIAVLDCIDSRDHDHPLGIQMQRLGVAQFTKISSYKLFTVIQKNNFPRGVTLYSQVLYVRQLWEDSISHVLYGAVLLPPPCFESLSPSNQSSWSFGLASVPPFERWTPIF
jgi:hypothetical protein